jgi:hypothetical protein
MLRLLVCGFGSSVWHSDCLLVGLFGSVRRPTDVVRIASVARVICSTLHQKDSNNKRFQSMRHKRMIVASANFLTSLPPVPLLFNESCPKYRRVIIGSRGFPCQSRDLLMYIFSLYVKHTSLITTHKHCGI